MVVDPVPEYFNKYRRSAIAEMANWHPDFDMAGVSVSDVDKAAGSPRPGDMIARNPKNHDDKWLVAEAYFEDNFTAFDEPVPTPLPDTHYELVPNGC